MKSKPVKCAPQVAMLQWTYDHCTPLVLLANHEFIEFKTGRSFHNHALLQISSLNLQKKFTAYDQWHT